MIVLASKVVPCPALWNFSLLCMFRLSFNKGSRESLGSSGPFSVAPSFSIPCTTNYSWQGLPESYVPIQHLCWLCLPPSPHPPSVEIASGRKRGGSLGSLSPFTLGTQSCTACCSVPENSCFVCFVPFTSYQWHVRKYRPCSSLKVTSHV